MHSAEVNTQASPTGSVGYARVHLRAREEQHASWRRNHTDLGIEFEGLFGSRLLSGVLFQKLGGTLAAGAVPFIIVVMGRAVAYRLIPITRMKSHSVF